MPGCNSCISKKISAKCKNKKKRIAARATPDFTTATKFVHYKTRKFLSKYHTHWYAILLRFKMINLQRKFSRRVIALFWLMLVGLAIGILIYLEQIPVLYVIATLSLIALLLIVAFADLENVGREHLAAIVPDADLVSK